jgi:hypothetical protein
MATALMSKRSFQIISLILSVLALIYMFCARYQLTRFVNLMYFGSPSFEPYIKSYAKVSKASPKDKVVIAFTLKPSQRQLSKLRPFIKSLLDQSKRVDDIVMTIPSQLEYPAELEKVVSVQKFYKDYRIEEQDVGNLILSVLREPESNTRIIIVNPEFIYGKDFVANMIEASDTNPNSIIYANDQNLNEAMLVKPLFFEKSFADYNKGFNACQMISECTSAPHHFSKPSQNYPISY